MSDSDHEQGTENKEREIQERQNLLLPEAERWPADGDDPIVELKGVHKDFGGEEVLRGIDLKVESAKITVIVGASGSGKSVLLKHMNGLLQPDRGTVHLFGQDVASLTAPKLDELRKRVGVMFQNYALFDSLSVQDNVAFPLVENNAVGREDARLRARDILEELGLGHAIEQFPATLSGGMKKRVSLARAIVANPELVLFDEPTTGLDPVMMEFVDKMIEEITEKYQLTSVLISHNMATVFRIADRIAVLHGGEIIAYGTPEEIRERDDEAIQKLVGGSSGDDIQVKDHEDSGEERAEDRDLEVSMKAVHKAFRGDVVLKGVDFRAPKEKLTTLIGGSGAGKSVMMKHILGLFQPDEGTVEVFGRDLATMSDGELRQMRTQMGMLFQHSALFDSMTVRQNVAFPLVERRVCSRRNANERANALLERLQLEQIADTMPLDCSSGQQKRVSLARALITEPRLLIFDEPTTGQDPLMSRYVEDMVVEVQRDFDVTTIVISHDMASAFRTADYIAMLHKGQIIAYGTPQQLAQLDDERVHDFVYAADVAAQRRAREERRG